MFRSKRLYFGVKTATAQFQRVVDAILSGIKGVMVRVDDILVSTSGGVPAHLEIALARSFVWWPGIDQDIEDRVRFCEDCACQCTKHS